MFVTQNIQMVIAKATMKNVETEGVTCRMADVGLTLEPLPANLAVELGVDVHDHLFTASGAVRSELDSVKLDPRVPNQRMYATSAIGLPHTAIEDVEVRSMTASRQVDKDSGREWIKAQFQIRFDLARRVHREWLVMNFGNPVFFTFASEQLALEEVEQVHAAVKQLQDLAKEGGSLTITAGERGVRITADGVETI